MPRQHVLEPPASGTLLMALTEHRFHPFALSFSVNWLSSSSHRVRRQSPAQICAEWNWSVERNVQIVPSHARKKMKNITSFDNTEVDFTRLLDLGQTLPQLRRSKTRVNWAIFLSVKPSFLLYTLYNGNRHRLTRSVALLFAPLSQPLVFV